MGPDNPKQGMVPSMLNFKLLFFGDCDDFENLTISDDSSINDLRAHLSSFAAVEFDPYQFSDHHLQHFLFIMISYLLFIHFSME